MNTVKSQIALRVESNFPELNKQSYVVLETRPVGWNWYIVVDAATQTPLWEGDDERGSQDAAKAFMQASDMAFWAKLMNRGEGFVDTLYKGSSLAYSRDGLGLLNEGCNEAWGKKLVLESLSA